MIARLLALALLIGQFGAEAHAYSHLSDNPDGLAGSAQSCRACLSFAPLASAVGGSTSTFVVHQCAAETFDSLDDVLVLNGPFHRAHRSRAPPTLL